MPATVGRPNGFAVSARLPVVGNRGVGLHITALLPPLPVGDRTRVGGAHEILRKSEQKCFATVRHGKICMKHKRPIKDREENILFKDAYTNESTHNTKVV